MPALTKEPQYQCTLETAEKEGVTSLGLMTNHVWNSDPRRLLFVLARYKFISKMFTGMNKVLEVGCADAFGTRIVRQEVPHVTAIDFDPLFIKDIQKRAQPKWDIECRVHDMLSGPVKPCDFDGAYALDVIEHIMPDQEERFVGNIARSVTQHGSVIIGMPSIHSQAFAAPVSKEGHVNCKDFAGLKNLMQKFFHHVFIFSMNDEVVHTGFAPMSHYFFALCCERKV